MELIFLGLMYSDTLLAEATKASFTALQMAPHTFQKNLLSGLTETEELSVSTFYVPPMGSFPLHSKKLLVKTEKSAGGKNVGIGYWNLPVMKQAMMRTAIKKLLKSRLRGTGEGTALLIYSLFEPFLDAAVWAKKRYPDLHICVLHTDAVPGRNDMERYMTAEAKRRGDRLVGKAKCADSFAVLTKYLPEVLEAEGRPFAIVECICNFSQNAAPRAKNEKPICLYTGSLAKEFGLFELVEAFKTIENAELWICGNGELGEYLRKTEQTHTGIRFFGFLPQEKLGELRDQASFLINPRRPNGTYTKYSFPSKTAEYMASGKPVVMYKLEGIPDSYDPYLSYLSADTPDGIAAELRALFATDYEALCDKAEQGRSFIRETASPQHRAEQILGLIKGEPT